MKVSFLHQFAMFGILIISVTVHSQNKNLEETAQEGEEKTIQMIEKAKR